ncbi:hypothetical protein JXC34_04575, partial [Candidatus Woesearchaeota archaeon]|nr:hypothetical protein [Candidatus Woesearchaeota archaeon]
LIDLLAVDLFLDKKRQYFSLVIFSLVPFFGPIQAVVTLFLVLLLVIYTRRYWILIVYFLYSSGVFLFTPEYLLGMYFKGVPLSFRQNFLILLVSGLGSRAGMSFFSVILAIVGFGQMWKSKKRFLISVVVILFLLLLTQYFGESFNIYAVWLVSGLAGIGYFWLIKREWNLPLIRTLSLALIFCGLFFSAVSFYDRLPDEKPNPELADALWFLEQNSDKQELIVSSVENGNFIRFFSKRQVLLDEMLNNNVDPEKLNMVLKEIFYSRNLENTKRILKTLEIRYFVITPDMKSGGVWNKDDDGLLFLFRNKDAFQRIYSESGIEIWKFLGS